MQLPAEQTFNSSQLKWRGSWRPNKTPNSFAFQIIYSLNYIVYTSASQPASSASFLSLTASLSADASQRNSLKPSVWMHTPSSACVYMMCNLNSPSIKVSTAPLVAGDSTAALNPEPLWFHTSCLSLFACLSVLAVRFTGSGPLCRRAPT